MLGFSSNTALSFQVKYPSIFQVSKDALHNFAEKINWSVSSDELLINALTHKSFVPPDSEGWGKSFSHNERLVFLGYQTASSFITEILYFKYPSLTVEQLWDLQNGLLREDLIAECGRRLGLPDLIFSKDDINDKIIGEALLAVVGSMYMDQAPGLARQFVENHIIPDLTKEKIKEICQLEHPKFMLKLLASKDHPVRAKLLEKHSKQNLYGEETDEYNVGIYKDGELLAKAQGDSQLAAEKNACQKILMENYSEGLKKAKFPLDYEEFTPEREVNLGLVTEGLRVVELEKGESGFGFCIKGGEMRTEENKEFLKYTYYFPPFVSSIIEGGAAERCGDLKVGDVILAINDKNIKGMSHQSVVDLLNSLKGKVKFTVKYSKKVLITDELETKFAQFKEKKLLSQLANPDWAEWHHAHSKENEEEYRKILGKDYDQDRIPE